MDPAYISTRDCVNEAARKARQNCEMLWEIYEPYADNEFCVEFKNSFDARYWEMYLTVSLIQIGFEVHCPKPGPDVGILFEGKRIWFEATTALRGADGHADQVPPIQFGAVVAYEVPNERMILRYLNAIRAKYGQYQSWLKQGTVTTDEIFVVAINPRKLDHDIADTVPPRILQAAFPIGHQYMTIDRATTRVIDSGFQFRDVITKSNNAPVATGIFLTDEYPGLSGLLCSRIDVCNQPRDMGADFQLVPNPRARSPLPRDFRLRGTYFCVEHQGRDGSYSVTPATN